MNVPSVCRPGFYRGFAIVPPVLKKDAPGLPCVHPQRNEEPGEAR